VTCTCGSENLTFRESRLDNSLDGGKAHVWTCDDCGAEVVDLPCEAYDVLKEGAD